MINCRSGRRLAVAILAKVSVGGYLLINVSAGGYLLIKFEICYTPPKYCTAVLSEYVSTHNIEEK